MFKTVESDKFKMFILHFLQIGNGDVIEMATIQEQTDVSRVSTSVVRTTVIL